MQNLNDIKRLSKRGNVIPLSMRIPSDLETPVSAYLKLAAGKKYSFLLESIEGGEKLARYSFIGFDPFQVIEANATTVTLRKGNSSHVVATEPLTFLRELMSVYRPVAVEGLPRFTGGGVGYFTYDTIRWVERLPDANPDKLGLPEMNIGLYQNLVAFDHLKQEIVLIANILHESGNAGLEKKYREASDQLKQMAAALKRPLVPPKAKSAGQRPKVSVLLPRPQFEASVKKAKKYIKEGDIFQVVLSRRWQIDSNESALAVYRRLRRINPSPYMFLLAMGNDAVIGSSPEMMVRVESGEIETRPIAGTRRRGKNEAEDAAQIADLLQDEKELAEHTMLLDLGRNDIGRVSKAGTVRVKDRMVVEKYSHVIHLVSSVVGQMQQKTTALDGHFACFPAGTVSGAPKIRAMEIIDELEPLRRGVYAGSIAYLDFWGNLDSCIAIRTVVKKGKKYFVQAGAGIVTDSVPANESRETEAKAKALIEAVTGERRK